MTLTPLESWLLIGGLFAVVIAALVLFARLDRVFADSLERRRTRVKGYDEEYRYRLAREAVARQTRSSNVRIGHNETRETE